jgi:hypothetical protein
MYRKPRFLEELHAIREEMSRQCDYDVDLFAEMVRSGQHPRYPGAQSVTQPERPILEPNTEDRERQTRVKDD